MINERSDRKTGRLRRTYFPNVRFNSNLPNSWTALANDIPRVLEGMTQKWSVDNLDVHYAEMRRLGKYQ